MPCEWQITRISFIVDEMDAILDASNEFTQSQLIDLINHWSYALSYITIHDYESRDHNKRLLRRMKKMNKLIDEGKLDEARRLQNGPSDGKDGDS
jgi:hypothetical protein